MTVISNIGIVILAAGSSSRLGRPKQLLEYQDQPLLQRMIDMAAPFDRGAAAIVLGAHADEIKDTINPGSMNIIYNKQWSEGIASSIRLGVQESIKLDVSLHSILFLLSDQPFVTSDVIQKLIDKHQKGNQGITASSYNQNIGVPAIFRKQFFQKLMELTGDVGAKKIMMQHRDEVSEVPFRKGTFDIDTPEDYKQLRENIN